MSARAGHGLDGVVLWRVTRALIRRPDLWPVALVQAARLARPGWWRHWPPLPLPDPAYLRFRVQTAYGDADRAPDPADVIAWLQWCRDLRRLH